MSIPHRNNIITIADNNEDTGSQYHVYNEFVQASDEYLNMPFDDLLNTISESWINLNKLPKQNQKAAYPKFLLDLMNNSPTKG